MERIEIIDINADKGQINILSSNNVRILCLSLFGMGITMLVLTAFLPIVTVPVASMETGIGLVGVGIWGAATHFKTLGQLSKINPDWFKRGIVLSSFLMPLILLVFAIGTASTETVNTLGAGTSTPNILLQRITMSVQQILSLPIIQDLTVYAHDMGMVREWIGDILSAFSILLLTVPFSIIGQIDLGFSKITKMKVHQFADKYGLQHPDYIAGEIFAQRLIKEDDEEYGTEDIKGAHELLNMDTISTMMGALAANGLGIFAAEFTVFIRGKDTEISEIEPDAIGTPLATRFIYKEPTKKNPDFNIIPILFISNPKFNRQDEVSDVVSGYSLSDLPEKWVRDVLNGYDPGVRHKLDGERLDKILYKSGRNEEAFREYLKLGIIKWGKNGSAPITSDKNQDFLKKLMAQGLLHEVTHGLAFHIPDNLENMNEEEREKVEGISLNDIVSLFQTDPILQQSRSYYIALVRALLLVEEIEKNIETTSEIINRNHVLEMFCDRFGSVFLTENAYKI